MGHLPGRGAQKRILTKRKLFRSLTSNCPKAFHQFLRGGKLQKRRNRCPLRNQEGENTSNRGMNIQKDDQVPSLFNNNSTKQTMDPLTSPCSKNTPEQGSTLITAVILIFMASVIVAGMLLLTNTHLDQSQRSIHKTESENAADAAASVALGQLENELLYGNYTPGTIGNPDPVIITNAQDESITYLDQQNSGLTTMAYSADAAVDNAEFTAPELGTYRGMKYQINVWEWDDEERIGAIDVDDNRNGTVDEGGGSSDFNEFDVPAVSTNAARRFTIDVTATISNYATTMRMFVKTFREPDDKMGIYSKGNLKLQDGLFDSYDGSKGSYGGSNVGSNIGTTAEAEYELQDGTTVKGDARWGTKNFPNNENNYKVTGTEEKLEKNRDFTQMVIEQDPGSGTSTKTVDGSEIIDQDYTGVSLMQGSEATIPDGTDVTIGDRDWTSNGKNHTINIGENSTVAFESNWEVGPQSEVNIDGGDTRSEATTILVQDSLTSGNHVNWNLSGYVEFKVINELDIGSGTTINTPQTMAEKTMISVGGKWKDSSGFVHAESGGTVNFQPNGNFTGYIYAPAASKFTVKPNGDFFGAVVGNDITMKPNMKFHYDKSLGDNCKTIGIHCKRIPKVMTKNIISQTAGPQKGF